VFTRTVTTLAFTLLTGWTLPLLAQPPAKSDAPPSKPAAPPLTRDREEVAEKDVPRSTEINQVYKFAISPEVDNVIKSDADKAVVDKVLKYYLFRLTWDDVQYERDPSKVGTVSSIMTELIGSPPEANPRLLPRYFTGAAADQDMAAMRQRQFNNVTAMTPSFIRHCQVLLQNRQPIVRVNAARVLGRLGEWGQDAVIDEFIKIIEHPGESDAVRLWAFRGLEGIFQLQGSSDIKARGLFQSKPSQARMTAALEATYKWLAEATKVPESKLKYLKPEELAAHRYIRRAAARALGASRRPLIVDNRAANQQSGPIAELLGNILTKEPGIVPVPDLRERLDVALSLAQLRATEGGSYQPDVTAVQLGRFLSDFGAELNSLKQPGSTGLPYVAQQLRTALEGFRNQPGTSADFIRRLAEKAAPLLEFIDDNEKNTDSIKNMSDFLRDNKPSSDKVIKPL
jgi:hypothetical protein